MICTYDIWLNVIFQSCLKFTISKYHSWYLCQKYYYKSCYFVKQKKMEAMKNVRGPHVFDLKLLKEFFYLVFRIYNKNSFDSRIIYR